MGSTGSNKNIIKNNSKETKVKFKQDENSKAIERLNRIQKDIRFKAKVVDDIGLHGYTVVTKDGNETTFYFEKNDDGETFYKNRIGEMGEPTPEGMTEQEFMDRVRNNGNSVTQMSDENIANQLSEYAKDRAELEKFLQRVSVRSDVADQISRAYRTTRKASRINRRNS